MTSFRSLLALGILTVSFSVVWIDAWTSKPSRIIAPRAPPRHAAAADSQDPFEGISHLIDDGNGNIRADLATSIWNWDNEHREKDHLPKFQYSTRAGLRLVDEIAKSLLTSTTTQNDRTVTTYSDLVQEGVVALMYAMAKYNANVQQESFEQYAKRSIVSTLTKVLAQDSRPITLPAHVMDLLKSAKRKRQSLLTKNGREPTTAQVAKELGNVTPQQLELYSMFCSTLSVERTMEIYDPLLEHKATFVNQASWEQQHGIDVDEELQKDEKEEGEDEMWVHLETVAAPLRDMIIDKDRFDNPDDLVFANMIHDDVQEFLRKTLNERELQVIELRYGLDHGGKVTALEDIGMTLGISASRVAQIEEQAMEKLRSASNTNHQVETYLDEATEVETSMDERLDRSEEEE